MTKSFGKSVFGGILNIVIWIILIIALNIVSSSIGNNELSAVTDFVNGNIFILVGIGVIILAGNMLQYLKFPYNLFYPLFNAGAGVLYVMFAYRGLDLADSLAGTELYKAFFPLYIFAMILVPLIILIIGLVHGFKRPAKEEIKAAKKVVRKKAKKTVKKKAKKKPKKVKKKVKKKKKKT
ncbi:hypothetical protein KY316_02650 [Candidatus Woesearchaeota archaeon]|nr:hypothetical protein [Candidatus Woesearchaeota archaeon]